MASTTRPAVASCARAKGRHRSIDEAAQDRYCGALRTWRVDDHSVAADQLQHAVSARRVRRAIWDPET
jgi:hypothetical protein